MADGNRTRGTQQRARETRDRLVDAALHEFAEKGFAGASTRAIAARAGVAQSAVPYHFTNKEALWKAAADRIFGLFQERFGARVVGLSGVDVVTRARLLLVDLVRFAAAHPELHRFAQLESGTRTERLEWLVETHVRPLVAFLRGLLAELEASGMALSASPDHVFYLILGAANAPYVHAAEFELVMGKDPFAKALVDEHAEAIVRLFFPELTS